MLFSCFEESMTLKICSGTANLDELPVRIVSNPARQCLDCSGDNPAHEALEVAACVTAAANNHGSHRSVADRAQFGIVLLNCVLLIAEKEFHRGGRFVRGSGRLQRRVQR